MNRSLDELIQLALDGAATPEQVATLERRLESDPEARRRHAELTSLFEALGAGAGESDPGIRDAVMRRLPPRSPASMPGAGFARRLSWPRLALPFLAGAASAVIVIASIVGIPARMGPDPRTAGTMSAPAVRPLELVLGAPSAAVRVTAWQESRGHARLVVRSPLPVRIVMSGSGSAVELAADGAPRAGFARISAEPVDRALASGGMMDVSCNWMGPGAAVHVRAEFPTGTASEVGLDLSSLPIQQGR